METQNINDISRELMKMKKELAELKEFVRCELEFSRRTEEAWQEVCEGKCTRMNSEDFLKEIKRW
ncbi:MAG: hypothetical protein AABX54_00015 [Nanoarchaeota archaeon]|mgnify:CR=1 FL=1